MPRPNGESIILSVIKLGNDLERFGRHGLFLIVSIKYPSKITNRIIVIGDNLALFQNGKNRL